MAVSNRLKIVRAGELRRRTHWNGTASGPLVC